MSTQATRQESATLPEPTFFRTKATCNYLNIGPTKLAEIHEHDETFPRKIRLSARCVGWRKSDLDQWLNKKATESRGEV